MPSQNELQQNFTKKTDYTFYLSILFLVLVICYHIYVFISTMWSSPITDHYSWRQSQTAIMIREIARTGKFFQSIIPVLGPPWTIPFEFPLYQSISAMVTNLFRITTEQAGRLVSFLSFYSMLPAVFLILFNYFRVEKNVAIFALAIIICTPVTLYWSMGVMIETLALALTIWFVLFTCRTFKAKTPSNIFGMMFFGCLAGLTKITTLLPILVIAGVAWIYIAWQKDLRLLSKQDRKSFGFMSLLNTTISAGLSYFILNIPTVIVNFAWVKYSDFVKGSSDWTRSLTSASLQSHNFGSWNTIKAVFEAKEFYGARFYQITGDFWLPVACFIIVIFHQKYRKLFILLAVCFLAYPLVFSNLYREHYYYWTANSIYISIMFALGLGSGLFQSKKHSIQLLSIAMSTLFIFGLYNSWNNRYFQCTKVECDAFNLRIIGEHLSNTTKKDDLLVILGMAWDPTLAFYADRYAFMHNSFYSSDSRIKTGTATDIQNRFNILDNPNQAIGAVLFCRSFLDKPDYQKNILDELKMLQLFETSLKPNTLDNCIIFDAQIENEPTNLEDYKNLYELVNSSNVNTSIDKAWITTITDNKSILFAHADSWLALDISPFTISKSTKLVIEYGIGEGAYNNTNGVNFEVYGIQRDSEPEILFNQLLDPVTNIQDQGKHLSIVKADLSSYSTLVFRTDGNADSSWDWSYWGDIRFER